MWACLGGMREMWASHLSVPVIVHGMPTYVTERVNRPTKYFIAVKIQSQKVQLKFLYLTETMESLRQFSISMYPKLFKF
jgi:hypothetical protein